MSTISALTSSRAIGLTEGLTAGLTAEPVADKSADNFEPHDGSFGHLVLARSPLARVERFAPPPGLLVHPQLHGQKDGAIFPLDPHYAPQFAGKGGRIFDKDLGTVFNVANVNNGGHPFLQKPKEVDTILIGLHGATHRTKSIGASLLNPLGILKQQAKKMGMGVLTVIPDLPLHGLGPNDPRFVNNLDFYVGWVAKIVEKLQQTYPNAKIALYGRSTGAVIGLELAVRRPGLIHSLFADSPYPPNTQEAQGKAIAERERARRLANPIAPDHVPVPFSEEMLFNHDLHLSFWNDFRLPRATQIFVRLGKHDDNYCKFPYIKMWGAWSQRTGIPVHVVDGEHNGLGGLQQKGDAALMGVAKTNASILLEMMRRDLQNHLPWRIAQKQKRERGLQIAKVRLEKLEGLLKAKEALLIRKQAAYEMASKDSSRQARLPNLAKEVAIAQGKVEAMKRDVEEAEKAFTHPSADTLD